MLQFCGSHYRRRFVLRVPLGGVAGRSADRGSSEQYQKRVAADFLPDLQIAAGIADCFFFQKGNDREDPREGALHDRKGTEICVASCSERTSKIGS